MDLQKLYRWCESNLTWLGFETWYRYYRSDLITYYTDTTSIDHLVEWWRIEQVSGANVPVTVPEWIRIDFRQVMDQLPIMDDDDKHNALARSWDRWQWLLPDEKIILKNFENN